MRHNVDNQNKGAVDNQNKGAASRREGEGEMKNADDKTGFDRRGFLKSLGLGVAGTAAGTGAAIVATPAEAAENAADRKKKRYRESDHVKNFYRVNRY